MMESRLANPDAECPRCGATAPPTDARLVTCAACGLTFQPHELQRPHRAHTPEPPAGITVTRKPGLVIARWPFERWIGLALAPLAATALIGTDYLLQEFGLGIATASTGALGLCFAYLAAVLALDHVELVITPDALIRRYRPLRLLDTRTIARAIVRDVGYQFEPATQRSHARHWVMVASDGPWTPFALARRADHARYLVQLIADTCDLAAR